MVDPCLGAIFLVGPLTGGPCSWWAPGRAPTLLGAPCQGAHIPGSPTARGPMLLVDPFQGAHMLLVGHTRNRER